MDWYLFDFTLLEPTVHHSQISMRFLNPKRKPVKKMIVDIHDFYRAQVEPSASNMLKMVSKEIIICIHNNGLLSVMQIHLLYFSARDGTEEQQKLLKCGQMNVLF